MRALGYSRFLLIGVVILIALTGCGKSSPPPTPADGGAMDGGTPVDGGPTADGGAPLDGGPTADGGAPVDGGPAMDGGVVVDGGLPQGQPCNAGTQCASTHCKDGVCCNQACTEPCKACNQSGLSGLCATVINREDEPECKWQNVCDASGACKLKAGISCSAATLCASGFCKDGVCCDTACTAACKACNLVTKEGTCSSVINGEDNNECSGTSACDNNGNCKSNNGQNCTAAGTCASGFCKDSVCCDKACTEPCQYCKVSNNEGTCSTITSAQDTPECTGWGACNADGLCEPKTLGLAASSPSSWGPSLAWAGNQFGLAWYDTRGSATSAEVYFTRISSSGQKLGEELRLTQGGAATYNPSQVWLVWADTVFAMAWMSLQAPNYDDEIIFGRYNTSGQRIGIEGRMSFSDGFSKYPTMVWTGSQYGMAWHDDRSGTSEIYFARGGGNSQRIGDSVRVTANGGSSEHPVLVWTGSQYALAWHDDSDGNNEIYFTRLSSTGQVLAPGKRLTDDDNYSLHPSMAWTGSEFGLAWHDDRDGNSEIYFTRLDATGQKLMSSLRLTKDDSYSEESSLVWTGSEYGLAWQDDRTGLYEIYFASLEGNGQIKGSERRISFTDEWSMIPSLAWAGSQYGVAWHNWIFGSQYYKIRFARFSY